MNNSYEDVLSLARGKTAATTGFGLRVRRDAGLSQSEIAGAIGVTPAAVSRWESGARTPRGAAGTRYGELITRLAQELYTA